MKQNNAQQKKKKTMKKKKNTNMKWMYEWIWDAVKS